MAEKIRIKGHEKFPLREGWLTKGLYAVDKYSKLFNDPSAPDVLGVGTNMVKSIRYWMQAFGLLERSGNSEKMSEVGEIILAKDLYFEDLFTLWILHSNIAKGKSIATSWYTFFNHFDIEEFEKDELTHYLCKEITSLFGQKVLENSVKDDVDVLLNMYSRFNDAHDDPEDKNQSPLSVLGLVKKVENIYSKQQPDLRKISEDVILYEVSCLLQREEAMSIDNLVMGENGIGRIYNLSRVAANSYLEKLDSKGIIRLDRTAGLDMVYKQSLPSPIEIIREHY